MLIPLPAQKEIGCSGQGCTEILTIAPPDDEHTVFTLKKPADESIEREYECAKGHKTKGYWAPWKVGFIG